MFFTKSESPIYDILRFEVFVFSEKNSLMMHNSRRIYKACHENCLQNGTSITENIFGNICWKINFVKQNNNRKKILNFQIYHISLGTD